MYTGKLTVKRFELEVAMPRSTVNSWSKMLEEAGYTFTKSQRGSRLYGIEEYKLFQRIDELKAKYGNEKKIAEIVCEAVAGGDMVSDGDSNNASEITRLEEKIDVLTKGQELLMKSLHLLLEDNLALQEASRAQYRLIGLINNVNLESITKNQESLMLTTELNSVLLTQLTLAIVNNKIKELDPSGPAVVNGARTLTKDKFKTNKEVILMEAATAEDLKTDAKREVMSLLIKERG